MDKPHKYSSTQVQMPFDVESTFLELGKELVSVSDLFGDGMETDPHVTLLYGIHEDYPMPLLIDVIETHPKFTVTLGNVSLFDEDAAFDVVKTEVDCHDLYSLRSALLNVCHYTLSHSKFIPHATIAFTKKGACEHLVGNPAFFGLSFVVDSIMFCGHDGSKRKIMLGVRQIHIDGVVIFGV